MLSPCWIERGHGAGAGSCGEELSLPKPPKKLSWRRHMEPKIKYVEVKNSSVVVGNLVSFRKLFRINLHIYIYIHIYLK